MYLKELNEAQKELVLDLLIHTMDADGSRKAAEYDAIDRSCAEMGTAVRYSAKLDEDTARRLLTEISSTVTLRKVLVELAGLAMSDMDFDVLERKFIDRYAILTGIKQCEFEEILRLLEELTYARQRLNELVSEPV